MDYFMDGREDEMDEVGVVNSGHCEDAPCCGCCGPQGDGDYYGRDDDPDAHYDDYDGDGWYDDYPESDPEEDDEVGVVNFEGMEDAAMESSLFGDC